MYANKKEVFIKWSRKTFLRLDALSAQRCMFRVRRWEHRTEQRYLCAFAFFWEGTGDTS